MTVQNERERLEVALLDIISSYLAGHLNTVMPGQIVSFDNTEGTATIQPCFQRVYADRDDPETLPPIEDVPVFFFGSGDRWQTVELEVDSYVLLVFSQRALATWFEQGGIVDPTQSRKFHLSDAIALAGLNPVIDALDNGITPNAIEMRSRDGEHHIRLVQGGESGQTHHIDLQTNVSGSSSRVYLSGSSQQCIINNGSGTAVEFARLKTEFNQLKSEYDNFVAAYLAHIHSGVTPGPPTSFSGIPAPPTPPVTTPAPSTAVIDNAESDTVKLP